MTPSKSRNRSGRRRMPVALTIAGSDSGGGAGIQADLKTFASLGVHGACALTCVTAQNPKRVLAVQACRTGIVRKQIEAVLEDSRPAAVKTGMLYSREIIHTVASFFSPERPHPPLVVDPVMVSGSGARLLQESAIGCLMKELLPRAALVTPNLAEAEILAGKPVKSVEDMRWAAKDIWRRFGCAALVKGGHLGRGKEASDLFFDGSEEWLLTAAFASGLRTHGTGCTTSAAIAGYIALGCSLREAVFGAKEYITRAIERSHRVAGHWVLNSFWRR